MTTHEAIETYINGNISDAKKALRNTPLFDIQGTLMFDFGYSLKKAELTALFFKGKCSFQSACDAE